MPKQPIVNDIIPPKKSDNHAPVFVPPQTQESPRQPRRRHFFSILFFTLSILTITSGVVGFVGYQKIIAFRDATAAQLRAVTSAAKALNTRDASSALAPLARNAARANNYSQTPAVTRVTSLLEKLSPKVNTARGGLHALTSLATSTLQAFTTIDLVSHNAFSYAFRGGGSKLLALLQSLYSNIVTIRAATDELENAATLFRIPLPQDASQISASLGNATALIARALDILNSTTPQHLLLLFQNPSEIRPSGGFLGSYADITIHGGNVTDIDVRDIYDPDGQLSIKVISPRALQRISPRWGARDANWFFDFPTSAANVISFLEQSKIYAERDTTFIGAIAVNVPIVQDLLAATGPIKLPDYKLTIDEKNFLALVQREVESGADNKAGHPKRILSVLTPLLLARLADLNDAQKRTLVLRLKDRTTRKDLQFYARDRALETYLQTIGVGGDIYAPDRPDYDDYFAFVRANIAGGKTDVRINETVTLESTIDTQGVVVNSLTVARAHHGDTETGWWYRMANQLFFQVLTPYDSTLLAMRGNDAAATPTIKREKYVSDPDVAAIESTLKFPEAFVEQFTQFGKTTFAGWFTVPAGATKQFTLEYQLPGHVTIEDGARYRVVIEKQSGSHERFTYTLHAPLGFIWKENNAHDFIFASDNLLGRTILTATLARQ